MNFVFLSPHFPPNFYHFAVRLKQHGVTVLGLADENYDSLRPELKSALTEYYRVNDMHNYDELVRALGYFTNHYGKLHRLDSHNEYWLESEAALRTDFNIFGMRLDDIQRVKRKSVMKEVFIKAGVKVARGRVIGNLSDALDLIKEAGYPLVAKPDVGVGAAATYKIQDEPELERFFVEKPPFDYLLEEYIRGDIETFDGLTDIDGKPVFLNSLVYSAGIMETVLADEHIYYHTLREIPAAIEEVGRRVLQEFDVRERFFHFEFFRQAGTGDIYALEVNMRPPGGMSLDMFNYSCDIDIYNAWASIVAGNGFPYPDHSHKYFCCYVGRKFRRAYAHSHDDVLGYLGEHVVHHEPISGTFSNALGNYGYLIRSPELSDIVNMAKFIQEYLKT